MKTWKRRAGNVGLVLVLVLLLVVTLPICLLGLGAALLLRAAGEDEKEWRGMLQQAREIWWTSLWDSCRWVKTHW